MNTLHTRFVRIALPLFIFFNAFNALAASDPFGLRQAVQGTGVSEASLTGNDSIIATVIFNVLGIVGVVFLILLIWGGFQWMTSAGNEQRLSKAKTVITTATIGLVIIVTAYATTYFIVQSLTEIQAPEQPVEIGT